MLISFLTVLTQVGGIILILSLPVFFRIKNSVSNLVFRRLLCIVSFSIIYLFFTFLIIPPLAKNLGRVPLSIDGKTIKPLNMMTCILNRHYVKPELSDNIKNVANNMSQKHPNTIINYLDANFPFYNGFPLLPHLSHNDGKKLDIAFLYKNKSGNQINTAPSFIGYGVYEKPEKDEYNMPEICKSKGFWQYGVLQNFVPQWNKNEILFDENRTKDLIKIIIEEHTTSKIFIEPHLKNRMGLVDDKIRFHGCNAVRHDDHIHLQIK